MSFAGQEDPFLGTGWSVQEPQGRWTDGHLAEIDLRIDHPAPEYTLAIAASAYVPDGGTPVSVHVVAGGHDLLTTLLSTGELIALDASVSAADLGLTEPSHSAHIGIRIDNPRAPGDYVSGSYDARQLGVFVRRLTLTPMPPPP